MVYERGIRISREWSIPLHLYMGWGDVPTRRQSMTLLYWMGEDWSTPSRTDYYLMQIACEVRRVLAKDPGKIRTNHFKLDFGTGKAKKPKLTREEAAEKAKASWIAALGATRGKAVMKDKDGNIIKRIGEKKQQQLTREERKQAHRERVEKAQRERREGQNGQGKKGTMFEKSD